VGRIGSGARVSAISHIFALRIFLIAVQCICWRIDLRIENFRSNQTLESNRRRVVYSFNVKFLPYRKDVRIRQKYCAIATRLLLV